MEPSALPSTVTVLRERTVTYLKWHSKGCEKILWPIVCIAVLVLSILLLAIACGTQNWIQLDVRNGVMDKRGNITLGLIRGAHSISYGEDQLEINTIVGDYFLNERLPILYLIRIYVTLGLSVISMLTCLLNIVITLMNSYRSVTSWWRGPTMMYILSLLAAVCGLGAVGIFLDHFLWELDPTLVFISVTELAIEDALTIGNQTFTSFQYLITTEGYNFIPIFQYSFYLAVAGACMPLLVTLLSWRLALLIPVRNRKDLYKNDRSTAGYIATGLDFSQEKESNFISAVKDPPVFTNEVFVDEEDEIDPEEYEVDMEPQQMSSSPAHTPEMEHNGFGTPISPVIAEQEILY